MENGLKPHCPSDSCKTAVRGKTEKRVGKEGALPNNALMLLLLLHCAGLRQRHIFSNFMIM